MATAASSLHDILLVDDEPDIRTIGQVSLRSVGRFAVTLAASGEEALAACAAHRPDLILLDVMMPELDGPSTLARLRADPALAGIPVIFMTAKVQQHEIRRFLDLGAAGVIAKPFDPMQLPSQIRAIVESPEAAR